MTDFSHEWVDTTDRLVEVVDAVLASHRFAVDTEFHRERTYYPKLALVQVAWDGGLVLVDPFAVDLGPMRRLFDGSVLPVMHAADQDVEVLEFALGAVPPEVFDTQVAAGFLGMVSPSLSSLIERFIGVRLPKGDRLTDWTRRPLTAAQRDYAASDVAHLLELHDRLCRDLQARGRLSWAEQECARLLARVRGRPEPDTAWWRLKESRSLRGRARGIAQELAAWRERRAAQLDLPVRFVLSDMAITSMAHRPPKTANDVLEVRGVDGRQMKGDAARQVVAAVERGASLPEGSLRLPPADDLDRSLRAAVTLVSAWVAQLSAELGIDAALLGTRSDLQAFLRGDAEALLASGWRKELVGEPVRMLVDGHAALAFDGRGGLSLEERSYRPASTTAADGPTRPE